MCPPTSVLTQLPGVGHKAYVTRRSRARGRVTVEMCPAVPGAEAA